MTALSGSQAVYERCAYIEVLCCIACSYRDAFALWFNANSLDAMAAAGRVPQAPGRLYSAELLSAP